MMIHSDFSILEKAQMLLAPLYGKSYASFTASGMAAVELALESLCIGSGQSVVVPDTVCYVVAAAVVRAGARLQFVQTGSGILPSVEQICSAVDASTAAVIAVHQFGLPFPVAELRKALPNRVTVIEDAAQAFGVVSCGNAVGTHADLVVTSFGPTKPLSLGGGGALFGNDRAVGSLMDRNRAEGWEYNFLPRSYPLPAILLTDVEPSVERAKALVAYRRKIVSDSIAELTKNGFSIWTPRPGDKPSWHRIPIVPTTPRSAAMLEKLASDNKLVQATHKIRTSELPIFRRDCLVKRTSESKRLYLVRADTFREFLDTTK